MGDPAGLEAGQRPSRKPAGKTIVRCREAGEFQSHEDFVTRSRLSSPILQLLADADVFRSVELDRRHALWKGLPKTEQHKLFDEDSGNEGPVSLPPLSHAEQVIADYCTTGLSLKGHPLQFIRNQLRDGEIVRTVDLGTLPKNRRYRVAGIVILRQRPGTAKGITFVTIEDETGTANLIVHRNIWEQFRRIAHGSPAWVVEGMLQRDQGVIHLIVEKLEDLSGALTNVRLKSRDFQ
ncbi:MAG: OB-fold nucleic acid binding domain-containing protein [Planctomycetales bacterium]